MAELRRIVWLALIAGVVAGVVVTAAQLFTTTPLILAAETYEKASMGTGHAASHSRVANTLLFNVLAGVGFGLILSALLSMQARPDLRQGLMLSAFTFLSVTLAPALGLPPELPGAASGVLAERQFWWIGTAAASAIGLALVALGRNHWLKLAGVLLLLLPHLIGAPQPLVAESHPAPLELQRRFIVASLGTTALFWLVLGAMLGWLYGIAGRLPANRLRHPVMD
jgi:cobalt transporter subunit CbtA